MATKPTVYVVCSDQHRNGKTLLARSIVDYLLMDGKDPFAIDTDAPEGPLRSYFPGRTALADFAAITGQIRVFDTILASIGRDYVVDLPARHGENFFRTAYDLKFFTECRKLGFRIFLFFVVDASFQSLKTAQRFQEFPEIDLFVPVRNLLVRSAWPEDGGALSIPFLAAPIAQAISNRRFSLREFVNGDPQGIATDQIDQLQAFLLDLFLGLQNLEPIATYSKL